MFSGDVERVSVSWAVGREVYRWFETAKDAYADENVDKLRSLDDKINKRILSLSESKLNWDTVAYGPAVPHTHAFYLLGYVIEDALENKIDDWQERWCEIAYQVPEAGIQKWIVAGMDDRASAEAMSALEIMNGGLV